MKLPVFKKRDEIPKGFEDLYEEKDGQWQGKESDTSKLEQTVSDLRTEKKDAEKKLKLATDAQAELQRKLDVAEAKGGDVDKKVTDALAKWEKDKDAAVKAVQDQLDAANSQLETYQVDNKLTEAFIAAGGRADKAPAALKLNKGSFKLVDGKLVKLNEKGEVTTEKLEDHFKATFKKELPEFYEGTKAAGGGAKGGTGKTPVSTDPGAAERVIKDPLSMLKEANEAAAA